MAKNEFSENENYLIYNYAKKVFEKKMPASIAATELAQNIPIKAASSYEYYIRHINNMFEGKRFTMTMPQGTILYALEEIVKDYGYDKLKNALYSVMLFVSYRREKYKQNYSDLVEGCKIIARKNNMDIDENMEIKTVKQNNNKNLILYGPPGTGKTYHTINYAVAIIENINFKELQNTNRMELLERYNSYKADGLVEFCTFHQSYGYEEFIEGIKPIVDVNGNVVYRIKSGIFKDFCERAESNNDKNFVFIIDEINRGNISKIFGELITLIEDSKREGADEEILVRLPYSGELFGIPNNVYIIGTMNTADRSIALIDTALRRRFEFIEMQPNIELLKNVKVAGIEIAEVLNAINKRIEVLYDRNHTIGHSFFMGLNENSTVEDLKNIFMQNILPLLQEYFYDDFEKIAIVLGDDVNSSDLNRNFITKQKGNYANVPDFDKIALPAYKVNKQAFNNAEAYIKIYKV